MNQIEKLNQIYDIYRTCALNKEYYGERLKSFQDYNTVMEIGIALFASGSALSALQIFSQDEGKSIWAYLAAVSAVLALIKPFLQLNKKIELYSRLFTGHLDNYLQLFRVVLSIQGRQALTDEMVQQFERALDKYVELSREDEPAPSRRLLTRCQELVAKRIPPESLWYPPSTEPTNRSIAVVPTAMQQ